MDGFWVRLCLELLYLDLIPSIWSLVVRGKLTAKRMMTMKISVEGLHHRGTMYWPQKQIVWRAAWTWPLSLMAYGPPVIGLFDHWISRQWYSFLWKHHSNLFFISQYCSESVGLGLEYGVLSPLGRRVWSLSLGRYLPHGDHTFIHKSSSRQSTPLEKISRSFSLLPLTSFRNRL
jgi:hypothetical protein